MAVAAGERHTCAINLFNVLCWGANGNGQLGNGARGPEDSSLAPTPVSDIRDAVAIAAGESHNCVIRIGGSVSCWGANDYGQLGNGTSVPSAVPVKVEGITDATAITAGNWHTCALHEDGSISCWGANDLDQLGSSISGVEFIFSDAPKKVMNINDAIAVSAGGNYTCAVHRDNTGSCWGFDAPSRTYDNYDNSGAVPQKLRGVSDVIDIAAGSDHTCALHEDSTISCWGSNEEGQLAMDDSSASSATPVSVEGIGDASAMAAGFLHSCAIHEGGSVSCWGNNGDGQLGNGTVFPSALPVPVQGIADAIAVATSGHWSSGYSCALHQSGSISCWGANEEGQLGNGTKSQSTVPVRVEGITDAIDIATGWDHTCALHRGGTISCWGSNEDGKLGDGTKTGWAVPMQVEGIFNATAIAADSSHSCALHEDGNISCWGSNNFGKLGNRDVVASTVPVPVEGISNVTAIATGTFHTCALLDEGSVSCWGNNSMGQLGSLVDTDTATNWAVPVQAEGIADAANIALGSFYTCALHLSGAVSCWGDNQNGQLGNIDFDYTFGFLLARVQEIGDARAISAGGAHTCAILQDNTITCWGLNAGGQLGHGFAPGFLQKVAGFGG